MKITTNFEIGQIVWYITGENGIENFIIDDYTITKKDDKIVINISGEDTSGEDIGYILEDECFGNKRACKEELIKKIEEM